MGQRTLQGLVATALATLPLVNGQQPGSVTPEVHPKLPTWQCTKSGGCVEQDTSVVLDWNYRWFHTSDNTTSCTTSSGIDSTLCPDEATCAQNCVVEGTDYTSSGIETSGSSLTLRQFVKDSEGKTNSVSPRAYLLGADGDYVMFKLLNQELSFDVDVSTLPCGENAALYFSEMDKTGGRNEHNTGGAKYGSGYCDAQCPVQTWNNGTLNTSHQGSCCNEMDILEANSKAEAFTPHPCVGDNCDKGGCGFNSYARGNKNYWAPGGTLDTSKPFTMVTQFITDDGTTSGKLSQITRYYVQNGQKVASAVSGGDTITVEGCSSSNTYGGLVGMGEALGRGMVLAMSIWNDASGFMNWLDSGDNGPCSETEGDPANILANHPDSQVVLSNIRWGDIDSTVQL
ncbi:concanavalin A-like lectin/glucanase domain-containing protein [Chaetomium tenue]|uniref:Concanavalin A-like lectin/glucanase domain-containing protein n=1 Tax=Chaetomium tenue TaxID=1854479 RepID=A0ACB7PDC4_9PEZI|nr:concanavalin A-like lectin/glucanase domain-containing protein [Chaetomium globosum]